MRIFHNSGGTSPQWRRPTLGLERLEDRTVPDATAWILPNVFDPMVTLPPMDPVPAPTAPPSPAWTPADAAGVQAWVGHGVGTVVAGGVGYYVGESIAETIYDYAVTSSTKP